MAMTFPKPPDAGWLEFLKLILGFLIVALLAVLALAFGLGRVEQESSFGLQDILGGLLVLSGLFAQWAFGKNSSR